MSLKCTGVGLMITCYPYAGSRQAETRRNLAKIRYITRPDTFARKEDRYILHFADKQCQNEGVVGGKGHSLAILTSIITDDVRSRDTSLLAEEIPRTQNSFSFVVHGTSRLLRNEPRSGTATATSRTVAKLDHRYNRHQPLQEERRSRKPLSKVHKYCVWYFIRLDHGCNQRRACPSFLRAVSIIQSTPVDEEIAKAVLQGLRELDSSASERDARGWRYAVRSSAIGEDSEETSAAGQNSTYLGAKDANDVLGCVAKCWASLFSYQSVEYR